MIVVGHSLNGLILPLVAARRPVAALVYLCAFVPLEGKSLSDQFRSSHAADPDLRRAPASPTGTAARTGPTRRPRGAALYPDLTDEDAAWAFAQLRPQAPTSQPSRTRSGCRPCAASRSSAPTTPS